MLVSAKRLALTVRRHRLSGPVRLAVCVVMSSLVVATAAGCTVGGGGSGGPDAAGGGSTGATASGSANPAYTSAMGREIQKKDPGAVADMAVRPALKRVYGWAKLTSDGGDSPYRMEYVVPRIIARTDGDLVYEALQAEGAVGDGAPKAGTARQTTEMTVRVGGLGNKKLTVILDAEGSRRSW